jgi:hypothetical protein
MRWASLALVVPFAALAAPEAGTFDGLSPAEHLAAAEREEARATRASDAAARAAKEAADWSCAKEDPCWQRDDAWWHLEVARQARLRASAHRAAAAGKRSGSATADR